MLPLVIDYLKTHSFNDLALDHGVNMRPSTNGTKASLNYDQINAKNGDLLAEQCRGLVIRLPEDFVTEDDSWKSRPVGECKVLAWPMNRFYNNGDTSVGGRVDWSDPNLRVLEKLDGTMIVMYYDEDIESWCAATRAVPDADLPFNGDLLGGVQGRTFSQLFAHALSQTIANGLFIYEHEADLRNSFQLTLCASAMVLRLVKDVTYVFELTTPENPVVVEYKDYDVTLLAARYTFIGDELPLDIAAGRLQFIPTPRTWNFRDPAEIAAWVNSQNPRQLEGVVVCDSQHNREKIKSKAWVLSSRAKDLLTVSRRRAVEAIVDGSIDDVIPIVDEKTATALTKLRDEVREYLGRIDHQFIVEKSNASDIKSFAISITSQKLWTGPLFAMWHGKASSASDYVTKHTSPSTLDHILEAISGPVQSPTQNNP